MEGTAAKKTLDITPTPGQARSGLKALVLAAGEGSRLRPLTNSRPKPMLPIDGQPLLEHTLRWLRSYGIDEVAINLHYRGDVVMSYFGDGSRVGVHLTYSPEETILGTAGAVRKLENYFDGPALIVYGDLLTNVDLERLLAFHFAKSQALQTPVITLSLYEPLNPRECGLVDLDKNGRVLKMEEKPTSEKLISTLAFSGVMVLDRPIIDWIPPATAYDFGYQLLPRVIEEGVPVFGLPIVESEYVIDIGTPERYLRAFEEWNHRKS